jgi:hypothetical protein
MAGIALMEASLKLVYRIISSFDDFSRLITVHKKFVLLDITIIYTTGYQILNWLEISFIFSNVAHILIRLYFVCGNKRLRKLFCLHQTIPFRDILRAVGENSLVYEEAYGNVINDGERNILPITHMNTLF